MDNNMITLEQTIKMFPKNGKQLYPVLIELFEQYDINTNHRIAAFLAQCSHESMGFTRFKESMNYSAKGILATWPSRFKTLKEATPYARSPEKLANKVYCDRMGNGPESSGDGFKHIGRGAIQLTGKYNYSLFAKFKKMTIDEAIIYLETLKGAIESACYYWKNNNLNSLADSNSFSKITAIINVKSLGAVERKKLYNEYSLILND